jgi:hypothetical protein
MTMLFVTAVTTQQLRIHALPIVCTVIEHLPNFLATSQTSTTNGVGRISEQEHFANYGSKIEIDAAS